MQISLLEVFVILITHFLADFVFQTHWQAVNKSHNNEALTQHVYNYSICWILPMIFLFRFEPFNYLGAIILTMVFVAITFIAHWTTDYLTSRLNTKLWLKEADKKPEDKRLHNFFVSIGFDQLLHYIQLFTTYYLLKTI